jgi:hypothetical protein
MDGRWPPDMDISPVNPLDVADSVKLDDSKLKSLISSGPGMGVPAQGPAEPAKQVGKPGEWNVETFLSGAMSF